jgi:hypothetical protein
MKKKSLLGIFIILQLVAFNQTYLMEDFSSGLVPPAGWTIDSNQARWTTSFSTNAYGNAPEAVFQSAPIVSTSRLISPQVDLTGLTSVTLKFNYYYNHNTGEGPAIGVATCSGGDSWSTVWEVIPVSNQGPEFMSLDIANPDVGQPDFQFCFYVAGDFNNLDFWYLDNIMLFRLLNLDGCMVALSTPSCIRDSVEVKGSVKNMGLTDINSLEIHWQVDKGDVHSTLFEGLNKPTFYQYNFTCDGMFAYPAGSYNLKLWIKSVNGIADDFAGNDTLEKTISVASHTVARKPCFEEFTSSTCAPCAYFNASFIPWCNEHEESITLVKYQMNWPSPGDPYYTPEAGERRIYCGVSWVPWLTVNGGYVNNNIIDVQMAYEAAIQQPGMLKLVSSHSFDGTEITIHSTALPFARFNNLSMHMIVIEKVTTGNVGTNGETEFHHVMMKMIPDAGGTLLNLDDRIPHTATCTLDLAGTFIEEMTDLMVVVLAQDFASREVYQSVYSVENGEFGTEARLSSLLVDGTPVSGFDPDVFTYNVALPEGTVIVPDVTATAMDTSSTVVVVPALELPGTTTVDVFAEDLSTHNTYSINFSVLSGTEDEAAQAVSLYPNPSRGTIYVRGMDHSDVKVFSSNGNLIRVMDDFEGRQIDLSGLDAGVYTLRVVLPGKTVVHKKINLVK